MQDHSSQFSHFTNTDAHMFVAVKNASIDAATLVASSQSETEIP